VFTIRRPARFQNRRLAQLVLPLAVVVPLVWFGAEWIGQINVAELSESLRELSTGQWLCGLVATLVAYVAAAAQERAIVAHLGLRPEPRRARGAAMAAAAVAQTVGFGPFVGAVVRRRLLPSLSVGQSFAISAGITLAFFAGLSLLTLGAAAFGPETGYRGEARIALVAVLLAGVALCSVSGPTILGLRRPGGLTLLRLGAWVSLDCLALCLAFWALLPATARPDLLMLLPAFLLGLGAGLASGCPAGAGPFEATMALHLPGLEGHDLLASLLAFRFVAYALPALCGGVWSLLGPSLLEPEAEAALAPVPPLAERDLGALARAEVQLVRQGDLGLVGCRRGLVWASRAMTGSRLFLGQPLSSSDHATSASNSLAAARELTAREALWPLLYKAEPRLAAAARATGWAVLPVAREAVLDPARFHTSGSALARLRRKLRAAEKAEVVVEWPDILPFAEMEAVSDIWVRRMGGERGLSMGRWARDYVAGQRVALARDASGRLLAFVTFHASLREWALDLMRSRDDAPDGTLYALVVAAVRQAAAEEVPRLSLAAVPESSFGLSGLPARWARRLTRASCGLDQFKQAFAPRWERRYIAAPGRVRLALGAVELALAIRPRPRPGAGAG